MKTLIYALLLVFSASLVQAVPLNPIVTCQIEGTQNQYTTRGLKGSADCSPATQEAACGQYASDPKLGPAKPIGCQLLTDPEQFGKAAAQAIMSRKNPQPPVSAAPAAPAGPPVKQLLPVAATCKVNDPAAVRKEYVVLVSNPECVQADMQKACDKYAQVPGYGPATATATACTKFTSIDAIKDFIKKESVQTGTGRFPGGGGKAVMCETRGNNPAKTKYKFAVSVPSCDPAAQKKACETHLGIADPIGCTTFFPDVPLFDYIKKHPFMHGLECQLKKGGFAYRVDVPDCSPELMNNRCKPKHGDVVGCAKFPDRKSLEEWKKIWVNPAFVTCRNPAGPGMTLDIPDNMARDCSLETQKKACIVGIPVGCKLRDIEGLKHGQASLFNPW